MSETRETSQLNALLAALAATAGWVDASVYVHAGAFAANMTGNAVLFALRIAGAQPFSLVPPAAALAGFVGGSFMGAGLGIRRALGGELFALAAAAASALFVHEGPARTPAVLFAAALAMGLQQAVTDVLRPRASTTYMSGTTARIGAELYDRIVGRPTALGFHTLVWALFFVGAYAAGHASRDAALAIAPPLVVVGGALLIVWTKKNEKFMDT